jgi:pimeloyl-ACP methyl ester carboxylesterase
VQLPQQCFSASGPPGDTNDETRRDRQRSLGHGCVAFAEDLKQFDVPTLIIHGDDDDQIVPIGAASRNRTVVRLSISPSLNRKEYRS